MRGRGVNVVLTKVFGGVGSTDAQSENPDV